MRENLWLAVIYNFFAVPIAVAGLGDPAGGGTRHVGLLGAGDRQCPAAWRQPRGRT